MCIDRVPAYPRFSSREVKNNERVKHTYIIAYKKFKISIKCYSCDGHPPLIAPPLTIL